MDFVDHTMKGVCFNKVKTVVLVLACCYGVAAAPLCLVGDFESQVQQLLSSQMLTQTEIANVSAVFGDLHKTLQMQWPGNEVIPFGSLLTGLAMKWSDADCKVRIPQYNTFNITTNRYLIQQTVRLLNQQPELYHNARANYRINKIDLLKFTYVPTQRNCDLSFSSTDAVDNSRMVGQYYSLDERALNVAAIIKVWFKVHQRTRKAALTSYILNLLIIFYLQQEKILPPFYLLQKSLDRRHAIRYFDSNRYNSVSVYQLLGGFFKYYSEFNFSEYVVSPLIGRPIHKKEFKDFESLPEELSLYKNYMRDPRNTGIELNTVLCVQDVSPQHVNIAESAVDPVSFISHVKFAATAYQLLPKDNFIRAILSKDVHEGTIEATNAIADIQNLKDCI